MTKHDYDSLYDDDIVGRLMGKQFIDDQIEAAISDMGRAVRMYVQTFESNGFTRKEAIEMTNVIIAEVVRSNMRGQS